MIRKCFGRYQSKEACAVREASNVKHCRTAVPLLAAAKEHGCFLYGGPLDEIPATYA